MSKKSQSPQNRIPSSNYNEAAENESLSSIPNRTNKDMSEKYYSFGYYFNWFIVVFSKLEMRLITVISLYFQPF